MTNVAREGTGLAFYSLSIVAGSLACNARCPFCVASMTPLSGTRVQPATPDFGAVGDVAAFARTSGAAQAMITSKGEPTLWPEHVTGYLRALQPHDFEVVDLQTNGVAIADGKPVTAEHLRTWRALGLDVVAISVVHWLPEHNRPTYLPYRSAYIDLPSLIETLHGHGFTVRLAAVMLDGLIDGADDLAGLLRFARSHGVEQVTVRPVNRPESARDDAVGRFVGANHLSDAQKADLATYLERGTVVREFPWGGRLYDLDGQNVCLTNSLTRDDPMREVGRQLIVFPDGSVATSWEDEAVPLAVLRARAAPRGALPVLDPASGQA